MRKILLYLAILMYGSWISCTERIEIELDEEDVRLVVEGSISNEHVNHSVRLTQSTSYFYNQEPPAIRGARVVLNDGNRDITLVERAGDPGFYFTPMLFSGQPGATYKLDIELPEAISGSATYTAEATMPDSKFVLDSIGIEYNRDFDFWLVKVYAQDPPTVDFYRFDTYLNGLNGNDTTSRAVATHDRFFNGRNTNGFAIAFYDGEILSPGDTITMIMSAISEDYYYFYSELVDESGFQNPLFSGPPANIRTNIIGGGLGYFYARQVRKARLYVPEVKEELAP